MEPFAELAFELLWSRDGLVLVAAVVTVTAVLSSGLAAFVIESCEGIGTGRDSSMCENQAANHRRPEYKRARGPYWPAWTPPRSAVRAEREVLVPMASVT